MLLRIVRSKEFGILVALIALMALISCRRPEFLNGNNLYLVSRQIALTAIVALGVFFVILTSGIDLSLGSTVCISGFICGMCMAAGWHPLLAVVAGIATGAMVGAANGAIVSYLGVTPFIVTLGMLGVARGAVLIMKHGDSIRNIPQGFIDFCNGGLWLPLAGTSKLTEGSHGKMQSFHFSLPVPLVVLIVVALLAFAVLKYTVFGRRIYAVGGNEEATALSGINTRTVKFFTYVVCSMYCAITGILFVGRFGSAQADAGKGMELDAIAAAVIGGTSLMGGQGSVLGVLIGASIMGVIRNGLVLLEVSSYWQELIIGAIIVLAAVLDVARSRKQR